ncbi:hypothetical protein BS47DRAFT_1486809 [Hydnum rufescens UP504]|uniref:Uncharacterized protein n=1 Tax=Hydnum rufescens UP504 TaxID=1448309 RepID=A0A9P6ATR0_9AGAM|nr:hypothetical protein BS47DRAFT_1486809 [Hydnum rufescens UP504]
MRKTPQLRAKEGSASGRRAGTAQSHLFTHSWNRLGSYSIPDLCSYIESTPQAPISLLKWCKGRNGLRHEFLLLKVDRPEDGGTLWLRLERRVHESALAANCIVSSVLSGDTVKLSNDFSRLFDASQSEVRVETEFTVPLPLETLRTLLSILIKESPDYKLYSALRSFLIAFPDSRVQRRHIFPSAPIEQLSTRASVVEETEQAVARHLVTSQEALDPRIEDEPSADNQISTSDRPSSAIGSGRAVGPGIPDILPRVRQGGLQEIPKNIPPDLRPSNNSLLRKKARIVRFMKSAGVDPGSDMHPSHPEVNPEIARLDLTPNRGGISVGINLGTADSGVAVAYGISPHTVEQILWPGPNRKLPTCVVYDAKGHVIAWAHAAQVVRLAKGWIRCEMSFDYIYIILSPAYADVKNRFKLLFDPTGDSDPGILPSGKQPIDVITDYLRELWRDAKPRILECGNSKEDLESADIWLSIPATWNVRNGEMMRDAAYAAGLVEPQGSQKGAGGRNQLHIISEPIASAVHCLLWKDLKLKPDQSFMVCDARGDTIDTAIYQVSWNVTQVAERCASGASFGSHFLDIYFQAYLEEWHRTRNVPLSEWNLAHYMHAFTHSQKLGFTGKQDERDLCFDCFDVSDYYSTDLSDGEFFNGQLVVPVNDLQERVFDPVVDKVLSLLKAQLRRVDSVDTLFLVGEFSGSPYLFNRIWDTFHVCMHGRIVNPPDPDIAASLGAALSGIRSYRKPQATANWSSNDHRSQELYRRDQSQPSDLAYRPLELRKY